MNTSKRSKQRDIILEIMKSTKSHPTADAVYNAVREIIPNISLGTVYRNLSKLVEENVIVKLGISTGAEHFDGNTYPHYHIVCAECDSIYDIDAAPFTELNTWAAKLFRGEVYKHSVTFLGLCEACKNKKYNILN